jgi:hypothetical protein
MTRHSVRLSFAIFHGILGVVIFVQSVRTAVAVVNGHAGNPLGSHLAILAAIEAIAAIFFLVPRTLRAGGIILLLIFAFAIAVHGITQELDLLVFAAGVLLVVVHGSTFSKDLFRFTHA